MKAVLRKAAVLLTVSIMALTFAACGGDKATQADGSAGIEGIVFDVPDSWEMTGASRGEYLAYKTDSDYEFGVSVFDEEDLADSREYSDDITAKTVQEYFDQINTAVSDLDLKKSNIDRSVMTVCDTDAYYYKSRVFNGPVVLNTEICLDDRYYHFYYVNYNNYNDEGGLRADSVIITDEELAVFDGVINSIREGDGNAVQMSGVTVDSVGSVAFEAPEGYALTAFTDGYVLFTGEESGVTLSVSTTTEADLAIFDDGSGEAPLTLAEEYAERNEFTDSEDKTKIAGFGGYKEVSPEEDGNYYSVSADFLGSDAIYSIYMDSDAWDWDGELKAGAKGLTQEDIAAFEKFLGSMKVK